MLKIIIFPLIFSVYLCNINDSCESTAKEKEIVNCGSTAKKDKEIVYSVFHNGFHFNFNISSIEFYVKVSKQFENWEAKYLVKDLLNLPQWNNLHNSTTIVNFILNAIYRKEFDFYLNDSPLLAFKLKTGLELIFVDFLLKLKHSNVELPRNLGELPNFIKELENRIYDKIMVIEDKVEGRNCIELLKENKRLRKEVVNLKLGTKIKTEFLYKSNFEYENYNKTIRKASEGWMGVRTNRIIFNSGRYHYSIKIDRTDTNCNIMLGFCSTEHNMNGRGGGFHPVSQSFMFYLHDGHIYESSTPKKKIVSYHRPISGDSFEVVIDFEKKSIHLFSKGNELGFMNINIERENLTPCIDLYTKEDTISLL